MVTLALRRPLAQPDVTFTVRLDDADLQRVVEAGPWYVTATKGHYGLCYAIRNLRGGGQELMHRFLLGLTRADPQVDHLNHDGLDNRRSNIRLVTPSENMYNRRLNYNSTSGVSGVSWHKASGKWRAYVQVNRRQVSLGVFATVEEAVAARKRA